MPSTSKSQQRLMGQAYALRKGDIKLADIDPDYRDQIKDLADGMTIKQLEDFAKTKHANLPDKVEENSAVATVGSVNGMGAPTLPGDPGTQDGFASQKTGSGDNAYSSKKLKRKKKTFMDYKDYIQKSKELRSAY